MDNLQSIKVIIAKSVIDGVNKMGYLRTLDDAIKILQSNMRNNKDELS